MTYYTVITREDADSPWFPQFGDHDLETARHEMDLLIADMHRDGSRRPGIKQAKIVKTATARQHLIDAKIAELNWPLLRDRDGNLVNPA